MKEVEGTDTVIMSDYELLEILSYLSLIDKLKLSHVLKQVSKCIDNLLKSEKYLKIDVDNYRKMWNFDLISADTQSWGKT